ncbi:MAG TPA: hypothetical protein VFD32_16275, partial [Dehalococcoidia bacterium]|nr:hypothetical protein [Dehalococcoidia bacterium]
VADNVKQNSLTSAYTPGKARDKTANRVPPKMGLIAEFSWVRKVLESLLIDGEDLKGAVRQPSGLEPM